MKKEKFEIGDTVFLIHLQQTGVVRRRSGTDLLYVEVDGDEIPVYTSDATGEIPAIDDEIIIPKQEVLADYSQKAATMPSSNSGVFLTFEPMPVGKEEISSFNCYLINDTIEVLDFSYKFYSGGREAFNLKRVLKPHDYVLLHSIEYDQLNEMPKVELKVRDVMSKVFTGVLEQKIRPQGFFNKLMTPPMFSAPHYCYNVQLSLKQNTAPAPQEEEVKFDPEVLRMKMVDTVVIKDDEVLEPEAEIDLHIEKLTSDYRNMSNAEMIHLQLQRFQQALERAIAHRAEKFWVIHGVGSGKLRHEIHRMLRQYKEVKSFSNESHPRYGVGATEVTLR